MAELKVWEKRVSQVLDHDDPEEEELADRFNKAFARLLKVVPKADRRALIDMINAAGELYRNGTISITIRSGLRPSCKNK